MNGSTVGVTKCVPVDRVLAQHEHRDVDDGEHPQQQQCGGAAQGRHDVAVAGADEVDQPEGDRRGEDDGDPRRVPALVHPPQRRGQHVLAGHAVEQPAGHQHVDQRRVGHREHRDERHHLVDREVGQPRRDDLGQRRVALTELLDRHQRHREDRDEHVDDPGDADAGQHHLGEVAHRVLGLLGHVHGILEARPSRRRRSRSPP